VILIAVLDGLRPDLLTPERLPYLHAMATRGTTCVASHAAFPTATRVNAASLATGCYPGRHGLVDNEYYSAAVNPLAGMSCADWRALAALAAAEHGRLLTAPTLAEILRSADCRMVAGGSGSPGTTFLLDPTMAGATANWALGWPETVANMLAARHGPFLGEESDSLQRTDAVLHAVGDFLVPERRADVVVVWITEPDHAQHHHGLDSAEALQMMAEVDRRLATLVARLTQLTGADPDCLVTSDHGFSTIAEPVSARCERDALCDHLGLSSRDHDVMMVGNGIYLQGAAQDRVAEAVQFVAGRPWVGAVFVRDDLLPQCPEAMPQSVVRGSHRRSPAILLAGRWWEGANGHGVRGMAASCSKSPATHGSASPYDLHNVLVAWGPHIREGMTSELPCGIVDLAPTVMHLLGITSYGTMDGRVLEEILAPAPMDTGTKKLSAPTPPPRVEHRATEAIYQTAAGPRRQIAQLQVVSDREYLDQVTLEG
jgi:arylsulfatase A-like enzyme